jgi:hypothetical protein
MKTAQRALILATLIADAPSGGGVFQPDGVPYTFTRTGTGAYAVKFDPRIVAVAAFATVTFGTAFAITQTSIGGVSVQGYLSSTATPANVSFYLQLNAIDKRT